MKVTPQLDERFRAAAASEGLLDVAYDVLEDTPIGPLLVGVTDRGVCRIWFDPDPERVLETLARVHGSRVLRSSKPVDRTRTELDHGDGQQRQGDAAIFNAAWELVEFYLRSKGIDESRLQRDIVHFQRSRS